MDTITSQTSTKEPSGQEQEIADVGTSSGKTESSSKGEELQDQETNIEVTAGKGFKFGRLKEEMKCQNNVELEDPSVIIANPAFKEEKRKIPKKAGRKQERVDKLRMSSHDPKFTQGGGIINRMYQDGLDTPKHKDEGDDTNQEVVDEITTADDCKLENDER